jgi:hypothetical protein
MNVTENLVFARCAQYLPLNESVSLPAEWTFAVRYMQNSGSGFTAASKALRREKH